jgi:hypothetical protein
MFLALLRTPGRITWRGLKLWPWLGMSALLGC